MVADGTGDGLSAVVGVALGWGVEEEVRVGEAVGGAVGLGESRLPQAANVMASRTARKLATVAAEAQIRKGIGQFIIGVFFAVRIYILTTDRMLGVRKSQNTK